MRIGWIGAGIMGRPMAAHLLDAGHTVTLVARDNAGTHDLAARGAAVAPTPRDVAAQSDAVFTILPDTATVEEVVFGAGGVLAGLRPGVLFVDMSSIAPAAARRIAQAVADREAAAVDAPVSGGETGAIDATLSIMAGATAEAFARTRPLFDRLGSTVVHVGPPGSGQVAKACNQVAVAIAIEAAAEALALAEAAGADPARVHEAISAGLAQSRVLERYGPRMLEARYEPGARSRLHRKDLAIASELAAEARIDLPAMRLMLERYEALVARGDGDLDHSAVRRLLRQR